MQGFKKIQITTDSDDITIQDGSFLSLEGGSFKIKDGVLVITPNGDLVLSLLEGEYESLVVNTDSGNCTIHLENATIDKIDFTSDSGDLTVDAVCNDISFESDTGILVRKEYRRKNPTKTVKVDSSRNSETLQSWVGKERIK